MSERFDGLDDLVLTTAAGLAFKGYLAENPDRSEDEAQAWAVRNVGRYIEDAWAWLLDQGERLAKKKR